MVQSTRRFFSLITLAVATLTTAYAAPTKRDCVTDLTQNVLISARLSGTPDALPLQLTRTPEDHTGYTDYVWIVSR